MTLNAVRHIAVADRAGVLAFGAFASRIQVWRREPPGQLAEFATVLDFGGQRLELSSDGLRCFAAAYHANGVACYDTRTGGLLWQRKDLKKVQVLRRSIDDDGVHCFFDQGAAQLVCGRTGRTLCRHAGVRGLVQSPFSPVDFVEGRALALRSRDGRLIRTIPRTTFTVLSACFSPDSLLISESGGGLRCFDAGTGEERWRCSPAVGEHFLSVAYCGRLHCFHGVEWEYQSGGQHWLARIDADGIVQRQLALGTPAIAVFMDGELVTSEGDVIDLHSLRSTRLWPSPVDAAKQALA